MSDSSVCAKKIMEEEALLGKLNAAMAESNAVSEKDRADYLKEHADYSESVDSLARGIQQLQSGSIPSLVQGGRANASTSFVQGGANATAATAALQKKQAALLQLQRMARMPVHAKRVLASFLDSREEPEEEATPPPMGKVEQ